MSDNFLNDYDQFILNDIPDYQNIHQNSTLSYQNEYLNQFFQQGVLGNQNILQKNLSQTHDNLDKMDEQTLLLTPKQSIRTKSKFHNYQKHLIITLRKTVKLQKYELIKNKEVIKELWKSFNNSRIYNKSLLRILFGEHMMEQQLNINLFKKEGFKSIIEKYSSDQIIQAQHSLRNMVLNHFKQNSLDSLLNSRKLPQNTKQLFKKYISQFIVQLEQGNVMKRLPKQRKKEILKR